MLAVVITLFLAAAGLAIVAARFRIAPTRRLALVGVTTAPVWLLSGTRTGAVIAAATLSALVIVAITDALLCPGIADLDVERALPATVGLGDRIEGAYLIRSHWPRTIRMQMYDDLPRGVERTSSLEGSIPVGLEGEVHLAVTIAGRERGSFRLGNLALAIPGPLGLTTRILRYVLHDHVLVAPSIAGVRRYRLLALQHRLRDAGVRAIRRRGESTNFAGLREYTVGDDPRHIDWKATARRRKLITREFTVEQGQTIMIAVDAGRLMTQLAGRVPRFEYALSAALVLADVAVHSGDRVGLILFDDEVRAFVPPMRGTGALQRLRSALIPATATMTEPDYAAAFRTLATHQRTRSLIVIFTDVIDARASQALIAHVVRGAVRHLPLVVALRNDALVESADPRGRATATELYESAAAEEMLSAREEGLERMRQAGVSVLDVSPRSMAAAVVNRYLEIKARSAL